MFFKAEANIFYFKTRLAIRGVVNFYNARVVTQSRRIGSILELIQIVCRATRSDTKITVRVNRPLRLTEFVSASRDSRHRFE
jgi:hypothetical protein